jgi:hypothetical protein
VSTLPSRAIADRGSPPILMNAVTSPAAPRPAASRSSRALEAARRVRGRIDWVAIGALALVAVFLKPGLHAAFRADDTWNSVERGKLELTGDSLPNHLWTTAEHFLSGSGRPNVLGTTQGLFTVWLFEDVFAYHAFLLVLTVAAAGVLYLLVREVGLSRGGGLLVVTLVAGALQFRSYHDGLLGYSGTIQLILILTLASVLVFLRGLRRDDTRLLVVSFLLFLPCPLLYEGTYTLVGIHAGVALLERRGWAAVRASLPFLLLGAGFIVLSYILRSAAPSVVPGYEVGGTPLSALRTYVIQLFAPLPASSLIFGADYGAFLGIGGRPTKPELLAAAWRGAVVFGLVLLLALRMTGRDGSKLPTARTLQSLAVIGGLLWLTSVVVISFSPKYQTELIPGRGHLPVLVQVFGWALVGTAVLLALLRSAARRSISAVRVVAVGAAGVLGFAAGLVGFINMRVVGLETPIRETRTLLEQATAEGAFESMPRDASLIFTLRDLGWHTGRWNQVSDALESMLIRQGGRRLDGRLMEPPERFNCPRSGTFPPADCEPLHDAAAWVRVRPRPGGGSVIVGRLPESSSRNASKATTDELRAFARFDEEPTRPPMVVALTRTGEPWNSAGLSWRRVEQGDDWAIYEARVPRGPMPVASTLDDPEARVDFTALGSPDQIVRIYGTKHLLP